jgi:DNA-binding beta-propeller fold protein YncE
MARHLFLATLSTLTACAGAAEPPLEPLPPPAAEALPSPSSTSEADHPAPTDADDAPAVAAAAPATLKSSAVPLPDATGPVSLDYLVADRAASRVWVPVGNTGSVDVLDVVAKTFTKVDGFKTAEREAHGKKRVVGPSAATVGDGVVYVGNRATSEVCVVDAKSLKRGKCLKLASATDGVAYVAATKEVWVTTPSDQSITVLDAATPSTLKAKAVVKLGGETEGYAVDEGRGLFFTNLEDKGGTLVVDVKTHKLTSTWNPSCGTAGPRGLAVDPARGYLFVACTDHVQVLDEAHDGAPLGTLDAGAGVDNLDYLASRSLLYVAAGKDAKVTVAHVDDGGKLSVVATGATATGARNAVVDANGTAYVADAAGAQLLILPFAEK